MDTTPLPLFPLAMVLFPGTVVPLHIFEDRYRQMVSEPPEDGRRLFERFVEIEAGHEAIVAAEINAVTGMGFWFDSREFSLEMG